MDVLPGGTIGGEPAPSGRRPFRARQVDACPDPRDVAGSLDYTDAVERGIADGDERTAEQWCRALFEGAPLVLRLALATGWRTLLLLRLGPRRSPDHILGWPIQSREERMIRLEASSPLLTSLLVVRLADDRVRFTTNVRYHHPIARPLWAAAKPVHRLMVPYLIDRAARRSTTPTG